MGDSVAAPLPDERLPRLLGEAPSKNGDRYHNFPLSGPPARVLCELMGIPPEPEGSTYGKWTWALYEHFETRNLIRRFGTAYPWRVERARQAALDILEVARQETPIVVVCLGRSVGDAFGLSGAPWGQWRALFINDGEVGTHAEPESWRHAGPGQGVAYFGETCVLPHPSGRNRTLNDPGMRAVTGRALRDALPRLRALRAVWR